SAYVRLDTSQSTSQALDHCGHKEGGMKGEGMHNTTPFGSLARATQRLLLALATGWMLLQYPATPASGYEAAPTLQASKVLPTELRSGAHFRVDDNVANDGYVNTYHIHSKFGTFTAVSTAMLAKRIGEVNALVVMEHVKGTTEFTNAVK